LPFAFVPLWQVAQVPGTTPVWLKLVGNQAVVRWQVSQAAVVATWPLGLPFAFVPLWQVAQVPGTTLGWLKLAGNQAVLRWQLLHGTTVEICPPGFAVAPMWLPETWHPAQLRGVPLKMFWTWQVVHRTLVCAPSRVNPVVRWLKLAEACVAGAAKAK
jgi:hypothetical protein